MRTSLAIPGVLALILLLGGCSVFGVATKDELSAAMQQEAAANAATEARLAEIGDQVAVARAELERVERRLQPRIAGLDSAMTRTEDRVARATQEWRSLQALMAADLDSVRVELDVVTGEVAAMSRGMTSVREGMTLVRARATTAEEQSRESLRRQFETLQRERDHLLARLQDLEARLAAWPARDDSLRAAAAASEDAASEEPEPGRQQGTIEIRPVVTPERDQTPPRP